MDFKTFSSADSPAKKHFAPLSHNWLPEAQVEISRKGKSQSKTWSNLQLPLYRRILEHWYPEECAKANPTTAYFVLPSDPSESGVYPFDELDDPDNADAYTSALECAASVTTNIANGNFWPPQAFRKNWDDPIAPLLVNGDPEDCIAPETIALLKGAQTSTPEDRIG